MNRDVLTKAMQAAPCEARRRGLDPDDSAQEAALALLRGSQTNLLRVHARARWAAVDSATSVAGRRGGVRGRRVAVASLDAPGAPVLAAQADAFERGSEILSARQDLARIRAVLPPPLLDDLEAMLEALAAGESPREAQRGHVSWRHWAAIRAVAHEAVAA